MKFSISYFEHFAFCKEKEARMLGDLLSKYAVHLFSKSTKVNHWFNTHR